MLREEGLAKEGKALDQNHCSRSGAEGCAREGNFTKCVEISGSPLSV